MTLNATEAQLDPTRTSGIRRRYAAAMRAKLLGINRAMRQSIVGDDCFGLTRSVLFSNVDPPPPIPSARTLDTRGKLRAFANWLDDVTERYFLEDTGDVAPAWVERFVRAAYNRGLESALADIATIAPEVQTTVEAILATPFHRDRLVAIFDSNFSELKGFSRKMAAELQRTLADGIVANKGPRQIATDLSRRIDISIERARTIARTEIIRTNADAELNAFEQFGINELVVRAEWITAGDGKVCPRCQAKSGRVYTIKEARGMIPLHPRCRCSWAPAIP